jgi:phage terminase large subunit-like protein
MKNALSSKMIELREAAENDLEVFINLVHPGRVLGNIHRSVITWWDRPEKGSHQMLLMPRDHMKSALLAYRVAWRITKNPAVRVLYISSTANLAEKQLHFIKQILTSPQYTKYWPEMIHPDEGKREKWTNTEISVDHPLRRKEAIRDPTVITGGLTKSLTGLHCDIAAMDDIVVQENAYTQDGRMKVQTQYSLLASIESAEAEEWIVGTRYFPADLYGVLMAKKVELFDELGELISEDPLYEVFQAQVESNGDGTGQFLWPRQQRADGKWFGFDAGILAKKKAQYIDGTQFRAQYYNNPNDSDSAVIKREMFQYYDKALLQKNGSIWTYKGRRLAIFAALDFAYTIRLRSDFTAIVVIGVDADNNVYVLDIERFKTNRIAEYFAKIVTLHSKWEFRKISCEVTAAQDIIVKDLKENYIKPYGLVLSVEERRPTRAEGSKEERIEAVLQPRYTNQQVFHYSGGNCEILEEELVLQKPPHDDIKDALTNAILVAVPPGRRAIGAGSGNNVININTRFGGVSV